MFIGRKKELRALRDIISAGRPTVAVIYGRRRIGKSELIKKAFDQERVLIFEGLENKPKQDQIRHFIFQLIYQTKQEFSKTDVKSWQEAFLLLYEELKRKRAHVVFDEFQWMANYRSEIVSELKPIWDQYISRIPGITLILCGSIASFMTTKVIKSSAFYGRTDLVINLKGFLLPETKEMLKEKGPSEVIEAQMLLGGIPKYLDLIREKPSIRVGMEELAFTETGYFVDEYARIFLGHFGKNKEYEKIVQILAKHPYGLFRQQLSEKAGIDLGGGLTSHLNNLESAGFISSATPVHKGYNSSLLKYHLSDAYLRFYFSFILPNLKRIQSGIHRQIFGQLSQSGSFNGWMGRTFEYLCMEHAGRISEILGFSGIEFTFGPYFRAQKKEIPGVQIDLLFLRKDDVITLCEAKYSLSPVAKKVIAEVERKAEILQETFKNKTVQKVLISRSEATRELSASGYFYRIIRLDEFL